MGVGILMSASKVYSEGKMKLDLTKKYFKENLIHVKVLNLNARYGE